MRLLVGTSPGAGPSLQGKATIRGDSVGASRALQHGVAAGAVYFALAVVVTWPLVLHPIGQLAAIERGDSYLNLWILGWDLQTLARSPAALFTGRIFDANIFHPATGTLAYSDHLLLQAVVLLPIYLATHNIVFCYNVLFFCSLVASAAAMHLYTRTVTGSRWGAYAAGIVWGFWPFHFAHLLHLQLQALYFLPLAFLLVHRLVAGRSLSDAAALGVVAGLQALASVYYGVIGAIGLTAGSIALVVGAGARRIGPLLRRFAVAFLVAALIVAPVGWIYWRVQQQEGFSRNLYEASQHEASTRNYLDPPPTNLVYGRSGLLPRQSQPERQLFPGFTVLALALVGLRYARRRGSLPAALAMSAVLTIGFVLSLGPDGIRPVYAAFHRFMFGFQAIRAPARFAVLVVFGLSSLAALGTRELSRQRTPWLPLAALVLIAAEYLNAPIRYDTAPVVHTAAGEWLRNAPEPGPVLYLPLSVDSESTPFMVESLEHGRPIVNGYSGQRPSFYVGLADIIGQFPSPESLWTLRDLNVRFVVSPGPVRPPGPSPLIERARFGQQTIYELRWTPELEAALAPAVTPPPPSAGPAPFRNGERAVYRIRWLGAVAAMGLDAGQATFTVESATDLRGSGSPQFAFRLSAETATWVSRFFEAHDRFESRADAALLPLSHVQHLREGHRRVDRETTFDHVAHTARSSGTPVAIPVPAGTRDPLTAMFYVRTLPIAPGYDVRIPVHDSGRNLIVDLKSTGVERIDWNGHQVEALRVEPRFLYRIERREPVRVTIWMSQDDRRVPIVLDLRAAFGTIRAELVDYRRE